MAGYVKRRNVGDALVMGDRADGERAYAFAKFLAAVGVDGAGVTAVEIVAGDEVVGRADGEGWARVADGLAFTMPKHQHGKIKIAVPPAMQADGANAEKDALVTSVLLYKRTAPAKGRDVVAISEATDLGAQLASNDEPHEGDQDQGSKGR
jgi:hypothetical protein